MREGGGLYGLRKKRGEDGGAAGRGDMLQGPCKRGCAGVLWERLGWSPSSEQLV